MKYNNQDYQSAIDEYKNGDCFSLKTEIEFLSRRDIPEYDKESYYFIHEALELAKKKQERNPKDKDAEVLIASLNGLSRRMNEVGAANMVLSSIKSDSLETEYDCVLALEKSLENELYEDSLTKIIHFIKKKRDFHVALVILNKINLINGDLRMEIAKYFIERMQYVIEKDIGVKKVLGGLWGYKSSNWNNKEFKNDDYVKYQDLVIKINRSFKTKRG